MQGHPAPLEVFKRWADWHLGVSGEVMDLAVLGSWLNWMVLEVFSNLNYSMVL